MRLRSLALATVLVAGSAMAQPMLTASIAVDNVFTAFISQDQTVEGTAFLNGGNWQQTYTGSVNFDAGGTYYLHVLAIDQGPPAMFVGQFSLTGAALFANGTQSLLTNATDWQCNTVGWNSAFGAPVDLGANVNGTTWGQRPNIDTAARFLWNAPGGSISYFTTSIRVAPTPGAGLGLLGGLSLIARRRR